MYWVRLWEVALRRARARSCKQIRHITLHIPRYLFDFLAVRNPDGF